MPITEIDMNTFEQILRMQPSWMIIMHKWSAAGRIPPFIILSQLALSFNSSFVSSLKIPLSNPSVQ